MLKESTLYSSLGGNLSIRGGAVHTSTPGRLVVWYPLNLYFTNNFNTFFIGRDNCCVDYGQRMR